MTLVTHEIKGIRRNKMIGFASSTEPSFTIEVATELVILLRNIGINFHIQHTIIAMTILCIETATNNRFT